MASFFIDQRLFRDLNLDEVFQFKPRLGLFLALKSLNWMDN